MEIKSPLSVGIAELINNILTVYGTEDYDAFCQQAIIDLNKPITTLFGNMNKNFKNKVKSADKKGVRIVIDVKDIENPVILEEFRGDIEISELQFEYEPAHPIIKNISLKVNAGEMLGIVGKTGAGKTTISNLIARLYDPKAGVVKIDGVDVKELQSKQLRKNIGIVSQDIFLFMGTIADNIRYAKPDATLDEVIAAAKIASAHSFITKLPDGYETRVGSGGQDLSGGEKQRISIARAILQNPKILILDEATAAMDTETERNIQNAIAQLKTGRTTIAIAHRLSTLRDADKLAVIDDGECIEFGTYEELMEKKGAYYNLYTLQEQALKFIGIGENSESKENENNE